MSKKPLTRDEQFLAKAAGDDVPMPKPRTRAQEFLKKIVERLSGSVTEETLNNAIAPMNASIAQLSRKTIQFRHGKGTFTATASGTNITWQYGGQQVQNNKCTFDVKSDNGLITLECDTIESLTIKNDTTNKMDLSDLGGKIANVLSLESCPNITGDLSDLGGKITSSLNLTSCPNITGDLSDLGSKITNWLSLDNCPNITGDLSNLGGKITDWLSLKACPNITGDLSDLGGKIANALNLGYCSNITGVYSGIKYPKTFIVSSRYGRKFDKFCSKRCQIRCVYSSRNEKNGCVR